MANSLGSLGSFQPAPELDHGKTGMRHAVAPPTPAAKPPLVGAGHGPALQIELEGKLAEKGYHAGKRSPAQIVELLGDCDTALMRLEKASANGRPVPELVRQLKVDLLSALLAEALALEAARAKARLEELCLPRWIIAQVDTSRSASRKLMNQLLQASATEREFAVVARNIFDAVKNEFPSEPGLLPKEG